MPMIAKIEQLDSVPSFNTLNRYAAGLGLKLKISITAEKIQTAMRLTRVDKEGQLHRCFYDVAGY